MNRSAILLVEDSADDVFLFQRALRQGGQDFDVHVAQSGKEAIHYLQRACRGGDVPGYPVPKFIIMDNMMPGVSGVDFLFWMSEHSLYKVIPTVVLSGSAAPDEVKRAFELGVHGYFLKPVDAPSLAELMKMIFQYWAQSSVPPVKEYAVTAEGEEPVEKI
jgi:CheY-like chemotaxis protein